jgi:hypothetical protein
VADTDATGPDLTKNSSFSDLDLVLLELDGFLGKAAVPCEGHQTLPWHSGHSGSRQGH